MSIRKRYEFVKQNFGVEFGYTENSDKKLREVTCHSEERLFATKNLGWTTQDSSLKKAFAQNDTSIFQAQSLRLVA